MYQVRRKGPGGFEDLMRELEEIEQNLITQGMNSCAMDLMVLEAKIRERFQSLDKTGVNDTLLIGTPFNKEGDLRLEDIHDLIPKDLPPFPNLNDIVETRQSKRKIETVVMAGFLALGTAVGVFGLASILQLALSWLA